MLRESESTIARPSNRRIPKIQSKKISTVRRRKFFHLIAKHAYPDQTAHNIRVLTKERHGESTIYDWMAGKSDAPPDVYFKIIAEILG